MRLISFAAVCVLALSAPALAWHDGGHKIVASIAFRQLSPQEQTAVVELLKQHPAYTEAFQDQITSDVNSASLNEWTFQQAAVFPDFVKGKHTLSKYNHPVWHYINLPVFLSPADRMALHPEAGLNLSLDTPDSLDDKSNVIQVIRFARRTIADKNADAATRALMVTWLMHTVGDVHQPLHSTAMYSQILFPDRDGDRGGNGIATNRGQNLHFLWDDFPGGRLKFATLKNRTTALLHNNSLVDAGKEAASDLDEKSWLKESQELAEIVVYDAEVLAGLRNAEAATREHEHDPISLSEDYLRTGAQAAEKRVVQAGFRLGAILSGLFD